jgi:hypothetical protein
MSSGIIQQDSKRRKRFTVVWDEANLLQNEELKAQTGPKQKITEPKTPFHYDDGTTSRQRQQQQELATLDPEHLVSVVIARRERDLVSDGEEEQHERVEAERRQFEKNRKAHYHNEFKRAKGLDDSDDFEEEEEEEEQPKRTEEEHQKFEAHRKKHYHHEFQRAHAKHVEIIANDDESDELPKRTEEEHRQFEAHRKAHYHNEFQKVHALKDKHVEIVADQEDEDHPKRTEEEHQKFESHRKAHYHHEFQRVQDFMKQHSDEESARAEGSQKQ